MTFTALGSAAARRAIAGGDMNMLNRYLTEGGAAKTPVSITTATFFANMNDHEGRMLLMNKADGITVTLPAATGTGGRYPFFVQTAFSGASGIIKVANATDTMVGYLAIATTSFAAISGEAAGGTDDTITMNATTSGGLAGSFVECWDIASGLWLVRGFLVGSGSVISSLSATVS